MSTLYISEYAAGSSPTGLPITQEPALAEQTVAISGSSTQSAAFGANTRFIRIHNDAICSTLIGSAPVALATNKRFPADWVEWCDVTPGAKIAVISNT